MSTTTPTPFVFDKDYGNLKQVAHLWDAYAARYAELDSAGQYPYNDSFKGHIEGLVADDGNENTAIYLLQVTRRVREYEQKVQDLRDQGFCEPAEGTFGDHITKYASVAIVDRRYGLYGEAQVFAGGRLYSQAGRYIVLPKRARTRGHAVNGGAYVLVKK